MKVRILHTFDAECAYRRAGFRRSERLLELHHLDRDLDHQPVVPPQVEPGELRDAAEPLAERVRVDVERLGGRADGAVAAEELLERREELRAALRVVVGELDDRVDGRVADRRRRPRSAGGTCRRRAPRTRARPARREARSCRAAPAAPPRTRPRTRPRPGRRSRRRPRRAPASSPWSRRSRSRNAVARVGAAA